MNDKVFEVGQIAWTVNEWNGVERIVITSSEITNIVLEPYYRVHYVDSTGGSFQYKNKIFETKSEAEQYWQDQYELRKQEYRDITKTKKGLLRFIIASMRWDSYLDQAAIEVVEEKLKEILKEDCKEGP